MGYRRSAVILGLAALAAGCDERDTRATAAPGSGPAAAAGLVGAIEAVLARCKVSPKWGTFGPCKEIRTQQQLLQQEARDHNEALRTYCRALRDKRAAMRGLALGRIAFLGKPQRGAARADEATYGCLLTALRRARTRRAVSVLSRASAFVGTALGQEQALLALLPRLNSRPARIGVYGALWAHGRLRVLDTLATAIKAAADVELVSAILRGFRWLPPKRGEEADKVCALLRPLMTNAKQLAVASAAAMLVSSTCPEQNGALLVAARQMVRRRTFDPTYARALTAWRSPRPHRWSRERSREVAALLEEVLGSERFSDATRVAALSALRSHDRARGDRLARRYRALVTRYGRTVGRD